ncbi:MAG: hypothetical protein IT204_23335 [Fimbriimonadaceae bacterium]|nr:hypothetical protein [Fimbriimonadaceae bacterium]
MARSWLAVLVGLGLLLPPLSAAGPVGEPAALPLRWGFDDIGCTSPPPWHQASLIRHPRGAELLRELGFDFWLLWYPDLAPDWSYDENRALIRRVDAWCAAQGVWWMPNTLSALWNNAPERRLDRTGYDWFLRPDGRRFYLFPDTLLAALGRCQRVLGVMYDEAEHHQNNANQVPGLDRPAIYDPAGQRLADAAAGHVAAVGQLVARHRQHGLRLYTEQVTPVMFHTFARAGCTAGTKVLKEAFSPAYLACALGASIQYGTELWVSPDLWGLQGYPSHSPEEYRAALLLAYHLGADCLYTESLALPPSAGAPYPINSLAEITDTDYRLTAYGRIARWFRHDYVPAHPRRFRRLLLRPKVVIVRQEDGCYGQRQVGAPWLPDRLFGSREWRSTAVTEAWLGAWAVLSGGAVPSTTLYRGGGHFAAQPYRVFHPLDGAVVYDEQVEYPLLRGAAVIYLTGVGVSPPTAAAIRRCVRDGATSLTLPDLAPADLRQRGEAAGPVPDGQGRWLVTRDFTTPLARALVRHVVPTEDLIRYRFGNREVTLRPISGDPNRLTAEERTVSGR